MTTARVASQPLPPPLALLRCPGCRGVLGISTWEGPSESPSEGLLECAACREWYPLTNGIPRLFARGPLRPDDAPFLQRWQDSLPEGLARPSSADDQERMRGQAQVQKAFGHKWTRQPWWGITGATAEFFDEWLLFRYGWGSAEAYRAEMQGRRVMLDAGCGLGREAMRLAAAAPAARVYGLELSECVDEAAEHARSKGLANVTFVQADLMAPPFPGRGFDFVISEGVLHHTPDTRAAFQALAGLLAPGGEIAFYVYRKKAPMREFTDDHVRGLLQGRTPDDAWRLMEPLTELGRALAELKVSVDLPHDVEVLGIKAGRHDVQRLVYYAMAKCFWNEKLSFDENVHVNFDWYYPRFAWRHGEGEVRDWLREAGLTLAHERIEASGITVRACCGPA